MTGRTDTHAGLFGRIKLRRSSEFRLDIQCRFPQRGTTAIHGPSGCGKTTLLYCLAGLLTGEKDTCIQFGGQTWQDRQVFVPPHQRNIGFAFQDGRLFPHLSVAGNLAYARQRARDNSGPSQEQVCDWLQLQALLTRYPQQLSRGQQQRVAVGRALLSRPDILFLDEPLANLDLASRREIMTHLQRLQGETDIPILYVSHNLEEAAKLADWLLVMEAGCILAEGPLQQLSAELSLAMAQEEQAAAILSAEFDALEPEYGLTRLSLEGQPLYIPGLTAPAGSLPLRLRIPARDVSLCLSAPQDSSILNILAVTVEEIEAGGANRLLLKLRLGEQFLLARLTRKSVVKLGLQVGGRAYAQIKTVALLD